MLNNHTNGLNYHFMAPPELLILFREASTVVYSTDMVECGAVSRSKRDEIEL